MPLPFMFIGSSEIVKLLVSIQLSFLEYYFEFMNLKAVCKILFQKNVVEQGIVLSNFTFNFTSLRFLHAFVVKFKTLNYF